MKTEMEHWLKNCPEAVITNLESRTPLEHLAMTTYLYPSDTHIFTSLTDLREMYEKLTETQRGMDPMNQVNSETPVPYSTEKFDDDFIIKQAIKLIQSKLKTPGTVLTHPSLVRDYLILKLAEFEEEHFSLILLDNQNRVIGFENIFRGTIDAASIYPREVVKTVLAHNAAAVIISHNHPSGNPEPSDADIKLTRRLKECLALIDVRILDHIIVGGCSQTLTVSFAERGLI